MYISTRGNSGSVTASFAIRTGMVPGEGLFVPESIPVLSREEQAGFQGKPYGYAAEKIFRLYLDDYTDEEIRCCIEEAYGSGKFGDDPAPLKSLDSDTEILELWHGPTAAFKDMALQILPHFMKLAVEKSEKKEKVLILAATSGDTGKAALEGFKDAPDTGIAVFYPAGGVSPMQELQMVTTGGSNTHVYGVEGNFDDCQAAVKEAFADTVLAEKLAGKGWRLSSANSINWGRLLPQIVYYFYAYAKFVEKGAVEFGEKININVPTGNFGNILAAYYAMKMGLPVKELICSSNENKVLTDFFMTGTYDRRRELVRTNSPSMDIVVSSNFERFVFETCGRDGEKTAGWMRDLREKGYFTVDAETKRNIDGIMTGGFTGQEKTLETIRETFNTSGYLLDTHTAVAVRVNDGYRRQRDDWTPAMVVSTASPFKFADSVLEALSLPHSGSEEEKLSDLSTVSGWAVHPSLSGLEDLEIRHRGRIKPEDMHDVIYAIV